MEKLRSFVDILMDPDGAIASDAIISWLPLGKCRCSLLIIPPNVRYKRFGSITVRSVRLQGNHSNFYLDAIRSSSDKLFQTVESLPSASLVGP